MKRTQSKSWMWSITMLALVACLAPMTSSAKDAVSAKVEESSVQPSSGLTAIMNNGNPISQGTYAVGTIQLFFTVNADHFPTGEFATFRLDLGIKKGPTTGQQTQYPVRYLTLRQTGSQNLELTPAQDSFEVTNQNWSNSPGTNVTITIPSSVANDPNLNLNGTDLVGNLQLAAPGGSHLDTPTTIQVHILLVRPAACLNLHSFLTDQGFTTIVTDTVVNMGGPKNNPKVVSTTPFGQFSYNILILNGCGTDQSFNLGITLDSHFETNPRNNPGNAVITYSVGEVVDPNGFNIADFGTGSTAGQNLWFSDITVPAGSSFLVTVHIQLQKGNSLSWLPLSVLTPPPPAGIFDGFAAELFTTNTTPLNVSLGTSIHAPLVEPNPAAAPLGFTVR